MEKGGIFQDFDDENVFKQSQAQALYESTRNFVVEFVKDEAQIAFDLDVNDVQALLEPSKRSLDQVRWINIWAPNRQLDIVELLGTHYKFSPRLLAIIRTEPPFAEPQRHDRHGGGLFRKVFQESDVELGAVSIDSPRAQSPRRTSSITTSHYNIAKRMINFQSIDFGNRFLCVGANWSHEIPALRHDEHIVDEGKQRLLWSWLVLCDDHTVISLHEDTGVIRDTEDLKSMRGNTLSVLSQLSKLGHLSADPISMQTVRQALEIDATHSNPGKEGASNLFYYLFDDWRAVYTSIARFHQRLEHIQKQILGDITRSSNSSADIELIPRLHNLGRQVRQSQHLYEGYKNLIQRILDPKTAVRHGAATPQSFDALPASKGVEVSQTARQRFERLGDRLQLLVLSETQEILLEKDALVSTYFSINAQKDSESTARLTRSATLLAKLSVLFLPVNLMTSYFSVQISDLQGVYTSKDYWYSFAVLMSISFVFLFFFSRLLMLITETLDGWIKMGTKATTKWLRSRVKRKRRT